MTSPAITSTEARPRAVAAPAGSCPWRRGAGRARRSHSSSSGYLVTVIGFAAIYGIFCTGLNFFMGYTGQASFGQNAFAALGGYGTRDPDCANYGWEPLVALVVAMADLRRRRRRRRLSDAAAARPLSRHGDLRARPHHLRDHVEWTA